MTTPIWVIAVRRILIEKGFKNVDALTEDDLRYVVKINSKLRGLPSLKEIESEMFRRSNQLKNDI